MRNTTTEMHKTLSITKQSDTTKYSTKVKAYSTEAGEFKECM